jgi:hypothetical protein
MSGLKTCCKPTIIHFKNNILSADIILLGQMKFKQKNYFTKPSHRTHAPLKGSWTELRKSPLRVWYHNAITYIMDNKLMNSLFRRNKEYKHNTSHSTSLEKRFNVKQITSVPYSSFVCNKVALRLQESSNSSKTDVNMFYKTNPLTLDNSQLINWTNALKNHLGFGLLVVSSFFWRSISLLHIIFPIFGCNKRRIFNQIWDSWSAISQTMLVCGYQILQKTWE